MAYRGFQLGLHKSEASANTAILARILGIYFCHGWVGKLLIWLYTNESDGEFLCVYLFIDRWLIDWSALILICVPALQQWRQILDPLTWMPSALSTKPWSNHPRQDTFRQLRFGKHTWYSFQPHIREKLRAAGNHRSPRVSVSSLLICYFI